MAFCNRMPIGSKTNSRERVITNLPLRHWVAKMGTQVVQVFGEAVIEFSQTGMCEDDSMKLNKLENYQWRSRNQVIRSQNGIEHNENGLLRWQEWLADPQTLAVVKQLEEDVRTRQDREVMVEATDVGRLVCCLQIPKP